MVRKVALVALSLVALAVVAILGARWWLGSDRGRATVERVAEDKAGGHLKIGKISGSLVGGLTLDDVEWRDDAGQPAMRSRRVIVHYGAAGAIAGHPHVTLHVEGLDADLRRLASLDLAEATRALGDKVHAITVEKIEVTGGTLRAGDLVFHDVQVTGGLALEGGALTVNDLHVAAREGRAVATGKVTRDDVELTLADVALNAPDLRKPLTGELRAHGPRDAIELEGTFHPDAGKIAVTGQLDLDARRGKLRARLTDVESQASPATVSGTLDLDGRIDGDALLASFHLAGDYVRHVANPNLPAATRRKFTVTQPGGAFDLGGKLVARAVDGSPSAKLDFKLRVDDPGQAARLVSTRAVQPHGAPLVLEGEWRAAAGSPAKLTVR